MEWLEILSAVGLPAIISGATLLILNRYYAKKDKKAGKLEGLEQRISDLEDNYSSLKKEQEENIRIMKNRMEESDRVLDSVDHMMMTFTDALQALLKDRIIQMYNGYSKEKRFMPIYAKESLGNMYKQFCNLGGADDLVILNLVNKLYALPTEQNDTEKL